MATLGNTVDAALFWRELREWMSVVEAIASHREAQFKIDHATYRQLHRDLMQMCYALMRQDHDSKAQAYKDLAATISPWVTVVALEESDRENLLKVISRSKGIQRQLRGVFFAPTRRFWFIMCAIAGILLVFSASQLGIIDVRFDPADFVAFMRNKSQSILRMIRRSSHVERLQIAGIITAILAIPLLIQFGKRY